MDRLVRQKLVRHHTHALADAHKSGSPGAGSLTSSPGTSEHSSKESQLSLVPCLNLHSSQQVNEGMKLPKH